jgi:HlyD family secretion protein
MQSVTAISQQNNQAPKTRGKKIIKRFASFFRTHRKKKIAVLIIILGVLIIFRILSNQPHVVIVNTAEAFSDRFEKNVFAAGTLEVRDKQEFFAEHNTTVKEIFAETGQKVTKGQVILKTEESSLKLECSQKRLSCDDLRAKLVQCESNLRLLEQDYNSAQQEYENTEILYENGAASKKELEDVTRKLNQTEEKLLVERDATLPLLKSQLAQAEMVYAEAEEKLRRASIISPIDGVLLKLAVKEGQEVQTGTLLAQIGNPEHLQIETGINEIDAARRTCKHLPG